MSVLVFVLSVLAGAVEAVLLARTARGRARWFGAPLRIGLVTLVLVLAAVLRVLRFGVLGWLLGLVTTGVWLWRRWS